MFCKYCGKEISDNSIFCTYCGKQVGSKTSPDDAKQSSQTNEKEQINREQQSSQYNEYRRVEPDVNSTGLNVLSFLIPLVGLILFCVYHSNWPIKANGCGKWALIGFAVGIVLTIILWSMVFGSASDSYY